MSKPSAIVVGAGPHGLLLALALVRAEFDVTVLGGRPPQLDSGPRALVFHWSMMSGMDRLGLLEEARTRGMVDRRWSMSVLATGEVMRFDLDVLADDVEHPFTLHLSQEELREVLLPRLDAAGVRLFWDTEVRRIEQDTSGCAVGVRTPEGDQEFRSSWIVGADGAHSLVRRKLGLGFPGFTWPERFVAVSVRYDFTAVGHEMSANQLDERDGALIAQIDTTGLWRYTYAEELTLPVEGIHSRLADVFTRVLPAGAAPAVESLADHRMHERVADSFRVGRAFLIGGAAHVTNPTSGFGLAGGFLDALALVEALSAVAHDGADEAILDRYAEERRRVFTDVTSPVSSETKELIWGSRTPGRLQKEIERIRRITASRAAQRDYLLVGRALESPSLIANPYPA